MKIWIRCTLTLILIITTNSLLDSNFKDENIMKIVKRNLLSREKEYLKTKPLSENLKNFIKRIKREGKKSKLKRNEDSNQNNMYILRDGSIIPLKKLTIRDTSEDNNATSKDDSVLEGKFTVVPLIMPKENTTICEEPTPEVETTCIEEEETITSSTNATTITTSTTTNTTTKSLPLLNVTDEYDMVPIEATTKGELLGEVIKDVKQLISYEKKTRPQGEASLCNVTGDWDSFTGGMQVRISFGFGVPTTKIPKVYLVPLEPRRDGFLSDENWIATGIAPFQHSSMISFTLTSKTNKKIASFLGECRICEGAESISGHWMLRRRSKNCKDREEAHTFFSDVLRKSNIRKLQHEHLEEIMSTIVSVEGK